MQKRPSNVRIPAVEELELSLRFESKLQSSCDPSVRPHGETAEVRRRGPEGQDLGRICRSHVGRSQVTACRDQADNLGVTCLQGLFTPQFY